MPINLKSVIEEDSAIRVGGFSGAIFLTYTLNLGFFEQIVAPALERAGCSNVLIIADPDGYAEAIEMGQKSVFFAGMRYVCAPLLRKHSGVQHVKLLFMAGADRGRLLVGSGNLTLHGYSQNLELYSHFEFDRKKPELEPLLAFQSVWQFLQELAVGEEFSPDAKRTLNHIAEKAGWLSQPPSEDPNFSIWHNYRIPIWQHLTKWRETTGLSGSSLKTLRVFSPYYDADSSMLRQFVETLYPSEVTVFISPVNTNLDGPTLLQLWPSDFEKPELHSIEGLGENAVKRPLHAKAIIGVENNGSWCIAGSANMTRMALARTWQNGGNLELTSFRWSTDPSAFDYLLSNPILTQLIDPGTIQPSAYEMSEQPRKILEGAVLISELTLQNKAIHGRISHLLPQLKSEAELVLLRSGERLPLKLQGDLSFQISYQNDLRVTEVACVDFGDYKTPYRWIDRPDILMEYGSRSYHERIQAKMDTVVGAESLIHELMEFLFDRVQPEINQGVSGSGNRVPTAGSSSRPIAPADNQPAPEADRFIVPERDASGRFGLGQFTRIPYERNIRSLRDLLSIALLKLTLPPTPPTDTLIDDDGGDNTNTPESEEERKQIDARQRLCNYVMDYSRRYSHRLCQAEFLNQISPEILLDNHLTLGRVLLEFLSRVKEFKPEDFIRCYWWIWAPLVWPPVVGIEGKSCVQYFQELKSLDEFKLVWDRLNLPKLLVTMTSIGFGQPPSWSAGLMNDGKYVAKFLVLQKMLEMYKKSLGIPATSEEDLLNLGISTYKWDQCHIVFDRIASYQSPAKERLKSLLEYIYLSRAAKPLPPELLERIRIDGLLQELEAYRHHPAPVSSLVIEADDEGGIYCPRCGGDLKANVITSIKKGKLVLCSMNADTWLYKGEKMPEAIIP